MVDEEKSRRTTYRPMFRTETTIPSITGSKAGKGTSVFLYGIPNRDKARLTTIMRLTSCFTTFPLNPLSSSQDQQEIPRLDLARLTNVAGTAVASLEAEDDLRRKNQPTRGVIDEWANNRFHVGSPHHLGSLPSNCATHGPLSVATRGPGALLRPDRYATGGRDRADAELFLPPSELFGQGSVTEPARAHRAVQCDLGGGQRR